MFRISNKNKKTIVFITYTKQKMVSKSNQNSCLVFTQHRTPNAI